MTHEQKNVIEYSAQDAGFPCMRLTTEDTNESYMLWDNKRCPSFRGVALTAILSAPSSVHADGKFMNAEKLPGISI